jgi:signal transduction histidine kinase
MSTVWMNTVAAPETPAQPFPRDRTRPASMRYLGGIALLVALYYGSAKLGFALSFAGPVGAVAWLPVGVAAAFLTIFGLEYWPGAMIADLLVNREQAFPPVAGVGQTLANVIEVVLIAWLIRRQLMRSPGGRRHVARSPGGITTVGWVIAACAVGTAASATLGPLSLRLGGAKMPDEPLLTVMRTYWLGDFCGALVIVPLALAWRKRPSVRPGRWMAEAAFLFSFIAALSFTAAYVDTAVTYIVFPFLAWSVFRFGMRGATLAVLITVSAQIVTETHFNGSFTSHSFSHSVLSTQLFILVTAFSALLFAGIMEERRSLIDELAYSRARASHAADLERSRIERDLHDGAQQRLLALALRFGLAADDTSVGSDDSRALFRAAQRELEAANDELRELSHGIHPTILQSLGLAGAIRGLALRSSIPVTHLEVSNVRLGEGVEAAAYFVVAETLANAHKYAKATEIRIDALYEAPWFRVVIQDNGRGGAFERPASGLAGLRQRVESLDGQFMLASSPHGTTVTALLPALPA